jgi:hypothetical protein
VDIQVEHLMFGASACFCQKVNARLVILFHRALSLREPPKVDIAERD